MTTAIRSSNQIAALLAAATQRGAVRVHERRTPTARPGELYLLPNDLARALQYLSAEELKRLSEAVIAETTRRTPPREASRKRSPPSPAAGRTEAGLKDEPPTINQGRANAIRAAVKAGVKPTMIARQFGVSLSAIRQVLADKS